MTNAEKIQCKIAEMLGYVVALLYIAVVSAGAVGWVWNIYKLFNDPMSIGKAVLRGVGVFVPPIGAILGYF